MRSRSKSRRRTRPRLVIPLPTPSPAAPSNVKSPPPPPPLPFDLIIARAYGPTANIYKDIFHVSPYASQEELNEAYNRVWKEEQLKLKKLAADVAKNPSLSALKKKTTLRIDATFAAYQLVINTDRRKKYDNSIGLAEKPAVTSMVEKNENEVMLDRQECVNNLFADDENGGGKVSVARISEDEDDIQLSPTISDSVPTPRKLFPDVSPQKNQNEVMFGQQDCVNNLFVDDENCSDRISVTRKSEDDVQLSHTIADSVPTPKKLFADVSPIRKEQCPRDEVNNEIILPPADEMLQSLDRLNLDKSFLDSETVDSPAGVSEFDVHQMAIDDEANYTSLRAYGRKKIKDSKEKRSENDESDGESFIHEESNAEACVNLFALYTCNCVQSTDDDDDGESVLYD